MGFCFESCFTRYFSVKKRELKKKPVVRKQCVVRINLFHRLPNFCGLLPFGSPVSQSTNYFPSWHASLLELTFIVFCFLNNSHTQRCWTSPLALQGPLWKPAQWHSQRPCLLHWTSASHSKWYHCPPEQTDSKEKQICEGGLAGWQAMYNNISHPSWPAEWTFWTQVAYSFLYIAMSNGNTFLSCLTAILCLDFITNNITCMDRIWITLQGCYTQATVVVWYEPGTCGMCVTLLNKCQRHLKENHLNVYHIRY